MTPLGRWRTSAVETAALTNIYHLHVRTQNCKGE